MPRIDCPVCKGGGYMYKDGIHKVPCPRCKGKGYIETKENKGEKK